MEKHKELTERMARLLFGLPADSALLAEPILKKIVKPKARPRRR